ncbi:MAG: hypothetical protein HY077_09330 [Elusimicrobia bacterium]|nr:hypothetical protein [Elusimicrobiota bacterium]
MRQLIVAVIYLVLFSGLSSAADSAAGSPARVRKTIPRNTLSVEEFRRWLLKEGKDRFEFGDRRAPLLNLPTSGVATKAWATGHSNPFHMCNLVVDPSSDGTTPKAVCIVLTSTRRDPEQHKAKDWVFRFLLDGSLEKAFTSIGDIDAQGAPVLGSGVLSEGNVKDPEIKQKAREELNFWLAKAYELTKKSGVAITTPSKGDKTKTEASQAVSNATP